MAYHEGQQIGNRYRIIHSLALGGMIATYLATDMLRGERQVAIQVIPSTVKEQMQLLERKYGVLAKLNHPNILPTSDFGMEADVFYFVTSYASDTLRQRHPRGSIVPLQAVLSYVKQVAGALQYAHDMGIIHRDVKPENMFIGRNNEILLGDFGIAVFAREIHAESGDESVMGVPNYMAPEQIQGKPQYASDQYALGVVVYEWLCGTPPFSGSIMELMFQHFSAPPPSLRERNPAIPFKIEQVVMRALEKDPERRFPTISEFAEALERASRSTQETVNAGPQSVASPPLVANVAIPPPPTTVQPDSGKDEAWDATVPPPSGLYGSPPSEMDTRTGSLGNPSASPRPSRSSPGLSSLLTDAVDTVTKLFSSSEKKPQEAQLSLFAIARTTVEANTRPIIGRVYTVQAGISRHRLENFRGEPFRISVQNPYEPLLFGILLHPEENVELLGKEYYRLSYDPRNVEPQFIACPFRLKVPGRGSLVINFYRERQWLKTLRFEFDGVGQATPALRGR